MALRINLGCLNFIAMLIFNCLVYNLYSFVSKDSTYIYRIFNSIRCQ